LQGGGTVASAYLHLWYQNIHTPYTDPVGKVVDVVKVTNDSWTQAGATWDEWAWGYAWDVAGGDYVVTNPEKSSFEVPATYGAIIVDITALMQDAVDGNGTLELMLKFHTESLLTGWSEIRFDSREGEVQPYVTATFGALDCEAAIPYGNTLAAVGIPQTAATLVADVICDGAIGNVSCGNIEWHIQGHNGDWRTIWDPDDLEAGVYADYYIGNLTPNTTYDYYAMFVGCGGVRMNGGIQTFTTAARTTNTIPVVWTSGAAYITGVSALLRGALLNDGGYACSAGVAYRIKGASHWTELDILQKSYVTGDGFSYWVGEWSEHLAPMTIYEYFAYAHNTLGYSLQGPLVEFTTGIGESGPTPPPTVSPGGIVVPPWLQFPFTINQTVKTILGIVITLIGMVLIVAMIRTSGGLFVAAAFGLGMTIVFTVIGWYSLWIILLIGAIVGLITFLILLGKR